MKHVQQTNGYKNTTLERKRLDKILRLTQENITEKSNKNTEPFRIEESKNEI